MKTAVTSEMTLLDHLKVVFQNAKKTTVKQWITHGNIKVNGSMVTNPSELVHPGAIVEYNRQEVRIGRVKPPYPVLYEDNLILVAEKPAGLLTVGSKDTGGTSFYKIMQLWNKENSRWKERLFIVHRLDREVSGILVFAKSEVIQQKIKKWNGSTRSD